MSKAPGQRRFGKRLPVIEVLWSDSQLSTGGWESHAATMRGRLDVHQRSVGYILADDKKGVMLAASLAQGGNVHGVVVIPAGQIVKRRKLR